MKTELDVFKEIEAQLGLEAEYIKKVVKFTDLSKVMREQEIPEDQIWCAVDFLPKKDHSISGSREQLVLLHLLINSSEDEGDGLYIADEQVRAAIGGMSGDTVDIALYRGSSDIFKEKKWNVWTRHLKFYVVWHTEGGKA